MLKPSYAELMDIMNKDSEEHVTSRYTVVIATAKRARQLIDGDESMIENPMENKPVSTAVEEIREGKIKIVPEGEGTILKPKDADKDEEEIKKELKETMEAEAAEEEENDDEAEDILSDEDAVETSIVEDDVVEIVDDDLEEIFAED